MDHTDAPTCTPAAGLDAELAALCLPRGWRAAAAGDDHVVLTARQGERYAVVRGEGGWTDGRSTAADLWQAALAVVDDHVQRTARR